MVHLGQEDLDIGIREAVQQVEIDFYYGLQPVSTLETVFAGDDVLAALERYLGAADLAFRDLRKAGQVIFEALDGLRIGNLDCLAQILGLVLELLEIGMGGVSAWTWHNSFRDAPVVRLLQAERSCVCIQSRTEGRLGLFRGRAAPFQSTGRNI
jgi:hypothetical protein